MSAIAEVRITNRTRSVAKYAGWRNPHKPAYFAAMRVRLVKIDIMNLSNDESPSQNDNAQNDNVTPQRNNPLHGVTLQQILTELVDYFGWEELGNRISIRCFTQDASIQSSLKFLRKTPWAREKVESLYGFVLREKARQKRQLKTKS